MNQPHKFLALTLLALLSLGSVMGQDPLELDLKSAKPLEIRHGMLGPRDTLLFYTFKKEKAVLKLAVGNKDTTFPVTGTLYLFSETATEEGLAKWLNNQHSDGLFPEIPEPTATIALPEKAITATSHKLIERTKEQFGTFENYAVTLGAKDVTDGKTYKLKAFKADTKVYVKKGG